MIEICDHLMMLTGLLHSQPAAAIYRAPHLAYLQLSGLRTKLKKMSKRFKSSILRSAASPCPPLFLQLCCEALCLAARNFALAQSIASPNTRRKNDSDDEVARVIKYVNTELLHHPTKLPILEGLDSTRSC